MTSEKFNIFFVDCPACNYKFEGKSTIKELYEHLKNCELRMIACFELKMRDLEYLKGMDDHKGYQMGLLKRDMYMSQRLAIMKRIRGIDEFVEFVQKRERENDKQRTKKPRNRQS